MKIMKIDQMYPDKKRITPRFICSCDFFLYNNLLDISGVSNVVIYLHNRRVLE